MSSEATQPREPFLVYLDTPPLVYWALPESHNPGADSRKFHKRSRQDIQELVLVFGHYRTPAEQIRVITTQWALVEAHSSLYKDALWQNRCVPKDQRDNPRYDPRRRPHPHSRSLEQATELLDQGMKELGKKVTLRIDEPDTNIWGIALRISQECAIYAPDCLHLATALHAGCHLFVTQDKPFLNLVHYFQKKKVIDHILQDLFTPSEPPSFSACPLSKVKLRQPKVPTALQHLAVKGYVQPPDEGAVDSD